MPLIRVPCELSGFNGGPGVNVWHCFGDASPSSAMADLLTTAFDAFYEDVRLYIQSDVTITIPNSFLTYNVATGQPDGAFSGTIGPLTETGSQNTTASHSVQAKVQLRTGLFEDGREIRGGPFIGPQAGAINAGGEYQADLITAFRTALTTLANTLLTDLVPVGVYRRPRPADPANNVPARPGSFAVATSFDVWQVPATQRRRRPG